MKKIVYYYFSNNLIEDDEFYYVVNGLTHQLHFGVHSKSKRGLESLVLDNNRLTRRAAVHINAAIVGKAIYLFTTASLDGEK